MRLEPVARRQQRLERGIQRLEVVPGGGGGRVMSGQRRRMRRIVTRCAVTEQARDAHRQQLIRRVGLLLLTCRPKILTATLLRLVIAHSGQAFQQVIGSEGGRLVADGLLLLAPLCAPVLKPHLMQTKKETVSESRFDISEIGAH